MLIGVVICMNKVVYCETPNLRILLTKLAILNYTSQLNRFVDNAHLEQVGHAHLEPEVGGIVCT